MNKLRTALIAAVIGAAAIAVATVTPAETEEA